MSSLAYRARRQWTVASLLLVLVSLGLQWESARTPIRLYPGLTADGGTFGVFIPVGGYRYSLAGYQSSSRVMLVAAMVILLIAVLKAAHRWLQLLAVGCLAVAVLLAGVQPLPGELTAIVAAILLTVISTGRNMPALLPRAPS